MHIGCIQQSSAAQFRGVASYARFKGRLATFSYACYDACFSTSSRLLGGIQLQVLSRCRPHWRWGSKLLPPSRKFLGHVGTCTGLLAPPWTCLADEAWRQLLAGDMKISVQELLLPANRGLLREVSPLSMLRLLSMRPTVAARRAVGSLRRGALCWQ